MLNFWIPLLAPWRQGLWCLNITVAQVSNMQYTFIEQIKFYLTLLNCSSKNGNNDTYLLRYCQLPHKKKNSGNRCIEKWEHLVRDRGKIRTFTVWFQILVLHLYAKLSLKEATFQVILSMVPLLLFLYCSLEIVYKICGYSSEHWQLRNVTAYI